MIASKIYNEQEGIVIDKIYGTVTTGMIWKFLKLQDNTIYIDLDDYPIKEITNIIGILYAMIKQDA